MVVAMVSVLSVWAQNLAKQPVAEMTSTSIMIGSGSTLPQAAKEGVITTYSTVNTPCNQSGPRRGRPGDNKDPYEDPLGDALLPLMLLACAYLIVRAARRRAIKS